VAQIKLSEMWKAAKLDNYPVKTEKVERKANERPTRQSKDERFKETGKTKLGMRSSIADGARLWNKAPKTVTSATTIWQAKIALKNYCKTLPI
jgi:hypothetical protein